jgi:tartrate dehydrogenase/decarboxylase/D-malate dehydrogenase
MTKQYSIAVIAGDGIGQETIPVGCDVLRTAQAAAGGFELQFDEFPWGTEYYLEHGRMMPAQALETLASYDAIYLGAIGYPSLLADHITLWGLLLQIRKHFRQYINLRPCRLLPGVISPLRDKRPEDIDFICVRENSEGEYAGVGGRTHIGTPYEVAMQTSVFTRVAVERVIRYSFELALKRDKKKKVTSVTKSNACQYSMVLWDEIFAEVAADYPDVAHEKWHVDAMAARFVTHPETLDVVVASNLFADILSDLGGAIQGSLGLPPSANINIDGRFPSMFESVHGSAPDIFGQGIANPIATIWSGGMMLEFLGEEKAAALIEEAIIRTTQSGQFLTPDLGGNAGTRAVGEEICRQLEAAAAS